uniref:Zinc finger protein 2 n=1 Tax=Fundulus heteroclitus TaxID=8078 RepID=A0A147A1N8_FUNHE
MEKTMELKMLLESSLKRIFQATVTDILVSVEQALSEYQGTIQTIQTENEGLKRLLSAQRSAESLHEGLLSSDRTEEDAAKQFSGSDGNNHPVTSTHTFVKVSKYSSEKTCFRKKNDIKLKESASSPPFSLQADQLEDQGCVHKSGRISTPVKTEPHLEESGHVDLCQPSLNQTVKLVKNESSEVTGDAFTDVHLRHPPRPKHDCRGSDHSVKVTVVSKGYTQEGHFIKIEEEAEALPGIHTHPSQVRVHKHTHAGEKPYACSYCEKRFKANSSLKVHLRTHTDKAYGCQQCEKTFWGAGPLENHMRTHTGKRPHCCTQCDKRFSKLSHLKVHYRIHTGERPYGCKLCRRTFSQSSTLNVHMRIHTGERPYSCDECGKNFTQSYKLKLHLRTHTQEKEESCTYRGGN